MSKTTKELQDAYSKYLWVRQKRYNELSSEISEEIDPLSDSTLLSHKEIVAQIDKEEVGELTTESN